MKKFSVILLILISSLLFSCNNSNNSLKNENIISTGGISKEINSTKASTGSESVEVEKTMDEINKILNDI